METNYRPGVCNVQSGIKISCKERSNYDVQRNFVFSHQVQSLGEVVDKIDGREEAFLSRTEDTRSKFELERSFSVSVTTPGGSPFTTGGKSRSESCKSRQSFSSRHSSLDSHLDADRASSAAAPHFFGQVDKT